MSFVLFFFFFLHFPKFCQALSLKVLASFSEKCRKDMGGLRVRGRQGAAVILSVLPFMYNRRKVDSLIFQNDVFGVVKKQISAVLVNRRVRQLSEMEY